MGDTVSEKIESYKKALAFHDWFYEYSDDGSVWRRGRENYYKLSRLQTEIDKDGAIWNEYAPQDFKLYLKG